ncbi:hypothetical protein [Peribacillus simplex]|uniref:Uncharacterized protein n=1 Tax=Peribacillus simplex TaxID=1478 RepID=A0AAW7IHE2_9BACI|nr:hypothetical protein [Peribacillus simplex]MDM5450681.1 hypothetical protein [Peribacillus simplex]
MKVREILELTQTVKLAIIAKERLDFGEKKAVAAMKAAGCYSISGKPGWHFNGDESVLEKSIYDFVPPTKRKAKADNTGIETGKATGIGAGTSESVKTGNRASGNAGKEMAFKEVATGIDTGLSTGTAVGVNTGTNTGTETGNGTDILDRLFTGLPATTDKKEVSFYLTHDVIEVINRAKKGNRSDLVNEALRKVFREKGWL